MIGLDWVKFGAGVVVGACLAFGPVLLYGKHLGRSQVELSAAKTALERITDIDKRDATFKSKSDRDRCIAFMRFSNLPVGECDQR